MPTLLLPATHVYDDHVVTLPTQQSAVHCIVMLLVVVSLPLIMAAQSSSDDYSKVDVFGGYSYLRNSGNSFNGWDGQATYWVTKHIGATADVAGEYRNAVGFSLSGFSVGANQRLTNFCRRCQPMG